MEQVFVGIGGNTQFGKQGDGSVQRRSAPRQADSLLDVVLRVGDAHERNAHRRANEAMRIDGVKTDAAAYD